MPGTRGAGYAPAALAVLFPRVMAPGLIRLLRIRDDAVKGFAMGLAAHGLGTAQAFGVSATAGAFAGLGLSLAGLITAFLLPVLIAILPF